VAESARCQRRQTISQGLSVVRHKKPVSSRPDPLDLHERCCVAPSPRLRKRIVQELHSLGEARDMNLGGRIVIEATG
jgi:hypothetical protein